MESGPRGIILEALAAMGCAVAIPGLGVRWDDVAVITREAGLLSCASVLVGGNERKTLSAPGMSFGPARTCGLISLNAESGGG